MKNEETRSRRERAQNTAGRSEGLSQSSAIDEKERAELAPRAGQTKPTARIRLANAKAHVTAGRPLV